MAITPTVTVASSWFAPGQLGELTAVVPFEPVGAVLAETRSLQRRLRALPSQVGIYFLLAMCPFPQVGYRLVGDKLTAGLAEVPVASLTPKGLCDLRRRLGSAPVRALFESETSYASCLLHLLRPDVLVLWDKGFGGNDFLASVTAIRAQFLWSTSQRPGVPLFSHVSPTAHTCR
ncbi:transposase domain-containing protein [Streptomyces sp. NPDC059477]|uniref:transposase domain-containing protein n=1 Tax=Streptomyces sp. NPDC059477 TaxID=3346847 RepID=UPI00368D65E7